MDREKIIKELESLRDICNAKSNMAIGNGKIAWAGYANTADDAIALLKEQQPKTGHWLKKCQTIHQQSLWEVQEQAPVICAVVGAEKPSNTVRIVGQKWKNRLALKGGNNCEVLEVRTLQNPV